MSATGTKRRACWSEEYVLSHCEGSVVETADGERIGVVDRVCWAGAGWTAEPRAVVIHGLSGEPRIVVPLERVRQARGASGRIVVPDDVAGRLR